MKSLRSLLYLAATSVFAVSVFTVPVSAAQTTSVRVKLWDKGAATPMSTNMAYPMPKDADPAKATMGIGLSRNSVPAGPVSFEVTNNSKDTVHEVILMYLENPTKPLPYIDKDNRVDEDKSGDKGEVSELDPGKSGVLKVDLKPGKYLLICNVPNHYMAGMWTTFTVNK